MIQCEYHNVGCGVMIVRKDWEGHTGKKENMEEHLMGAHQQLTVALRQIDHLTVMVNSLFTQPKNSNVASSVSVVKWSIQFDASVAMRKSCDRKYQVMVKVSGKRKEWYTIIVPLFTLKFCVRYFQLVSSGAKVNGSGMKVVYHGIS